MKKIIITLLGTLVCVFSGCGPITNSGKEYLIFSSGSSSSPETSEDIIEDEFEQENELVEVTLESVVDGDTLKVCFPDGNTRKVRLLSVNAEESVASDESRNNEYGVMASDYLKEYLSNTNTLWLQYDVEQQDQYGRELCYVWLSDQVDVTNNGDIENYMLNAILLKNGYVYTVIYEPNHRYKDIFLDIEELARNESIGLWRFEEFHLLWKKI